MSDSDATGPVRPAPGAVVQGGVTPYTQQIRIGHHQLLADEPAARGGADQGPSPYALLLGALGACTSITLRMYADRKGWDLGEIHVELRHTREGDRDLIARAVHFTKPVTPEQQARLAEIAEKTPVTRTVLHGAAITTTFG